MTHIFSFLLHYFTSWIKIEGFPDKRWLLIPYLPPIGLAPLMNVGLIGHESTDDPQFDRMTAGGDVTTEELLMACER